MKRMKLLEYIREQARAGGMNCRANINCGELIDILEELETLRKPETCTCLEKQGDDPTCPKHGSANDHYRKHEQELADAQDSRDFAYTREINRP
jgi:hypothetical protein